MRECSHSTMGTHVLNTVLIRIFYFVSLLSSVSGYHGRECSPSGFSFSSYCYEYRTKYELEAEGGSWWSSTTYSKKSVSVLYKICCPGHGGPNCLPMCHGVASAQSCNRYEGRVEHKDGEVVTCSGGLCLAPDRCSSCNVGYYASNDGYCRACEPIVNCKVPQCSSFGASTCAYCDGEVIYGKPGKYAFTSHLDASSCQRACSWRSGYRCFPGTCDSNSLFSTCQCAEGFTGTDCAVFDTNFSDKLHILNPELILKTSRSTDPVLVVPDPAAPSEVKWTNVVTWTNMDVEINTMYDVPALTPGPHIDAANTKIGIDFVKFEVKLTRGSSVATYPVVKYCDFVKTCRFYVQSFGLSSTTLTTILSGGSFAHGDKLTLNVYMANGGSVSYYNAESGGTGRYTIQGMTIQHDSIDLKFDLYNPVHCLEINPSCTTQPLVTPDFSTSKTFTITWGGWTDADSQLHQYKVFVYPLIMLDPVAKTLVKQERIMFSTIVSHSSPASASITLTERGVFMVELQALDFAGNMKPTRRILMIDDASVVTRINQPIKVTTASSGTGTVWINTLSPIQVSWKNRFINLDHVNNNWLIDVKQSDYIARELDDLNTVSARNLTGIYNIQGIVSVDVTYLTTNGLDLTRIPGSAVPVSRADFDQQMTSVPETLVDGKQLVITVKAYDVMGSFAEESTTVNIDLSPPEIINMWLTKGDVLNISVHSVAELNLVTFEWEAYDVHSGLYNVSWRLFDNYTKTDIVHGVAHETPQGNSQTLSACQTTYGSYPRGQNCYCTPAVGCFHQHYQIKPSIVANGNGGILSGMENGVHESEYFFEVTVFNHAGLKTTVYYKITIDTSPPHKGIVQDGVPGQPEVDFTQSLDISAHWSGFFDRESGVAFYKYAFGTSCLPKSAFQPGSSVNLIKTYTTTATYTAQANGTYYITVAAFNHAIDPSEPVCSDGITIDTDTPVISEVVVKGVATEEGLIKDANNNVWILYKDRVIEKISHPTQACIGNATLVSSEILTAIPMKRLMNGSLSVIASASICLRYTGVTSPVLSYLSSDVHILLSWNVTTTASGIFDYEIGLSTNGIAADKTAFASTNQHQHAKLVYPNIWDGNMFYILIKAISKSAIEVIKAVGPFVVETVSPDASAVVVVVGYETVNNNGYLVATWDPSLFSSAAGHLTLKYSFAVGTSPSGHNILPFKALTPGGSCTNTSCTAVAVSQLPWHLHGNQKYYVTVKGTNVAGLFATATSSAYVHNVDLASEGIVFDVKPTTMALIQDIEDIDFQTSVNSLSVKWSGFAHPNLDIVFHVCIREGNTTAYIHCEQASNSNSHTFTSLALTTYVTYYQVVIAETPAGNTTVSSDGVTIVVQNGVLSGITVYDGQFCQSLDNAFPNLPNASHHTSDKRASCQNDVEYQSATNILQAYWTIPSAIRSYVPDVYYAIEQQHEVTKVWTELYGYEHIQTADHVKVTGLFLEAGQRYRTTLKLCAAEFCFAPVSSSGVTVIPTPPTTTNITASYNNLTDVVTVQFARFYDPDIASHSEAEAVMDHYEWAFTDNSHNGRLLTRWDTQYVTDSPANAVVTISIPNSRSITATKCWKVAVRGYSQAGLSALTSTTLRNCNDLEQVAPAIVIDAVGLPLMTADSSTTNHEGQPITLEENKYWLETDKDYTPYKNIISATWPTLRYENYGWAVLEVQTMDPTVFYHDTNLQLRDPCSHPDAIKCGETRQEYMNAFFTNGELVHGKRYIVCIVANATSIKYEKWTLHLGNISVCSDGITVDITPPTPADVWIGTNMDTMYQITSTDMSVNWKPFVDVEEMNFAVHASGISHYEVALGSSKKGVDIQDFVTVGLTNHHTFHGLQLQPGFSYYATVRATDFTGQSSEQTSRAVKVDTTPPLLTDKSVTLGNRYIMETERVSACWKGVFVDLQSGMSHYTWAVGSFKGYDDMMPYTETTSECSQSNISQPLELKEGHAYFVSVKGYNRAGQYSLAVSWAFVVDATPPVKGQVYDGLRPGPGLLQDIDFSPNTTTVSAHWTEFYEAHGTIRDYIVSIGTCPSCDDLVSQQSVGIAHDVTVDQVSLSLGRKYYVTVRACNTAGLCSSVSSDGFICDSTPPIPGQVIDGTEGRDIQYQASRINVGAEWYGFADPQSGLSHYVWTVGSTRGGADIVAAENVHMAQEAFIIDLQQYLGTQLPVGVPLYVTVRAYNNAGMYTEVTSNGFFVDTSAPTFTSALRQSNIGTTAALTSVMRSVLKVEWSVEDPETFIDEQYLSINAHLGGDFSLSSVKVEGIVRDYTFVGLDLHDGSRYDVSIVSCNGAKLCTTSTVANILVDSSHPKPGTFAINTDHAARLDRQDGSWMTWTILYVNLAWLGFEDDHSGIDRYYLNFGSTYNGDDLNRVPGQPEVIRHNSNGAMVDEGMVQVHQIYTASLARTSILYISMWAVNGVGLPSPMVHAKFNLVYGGAMFLVRKCATESCLGHCVCAPNDKLCRSTVQCQDVTANNPNSLLKVNDLIDIKFPPASSSLYFTPLATMMAGRWSVIQSRGLQPTWYEWSVGLSSQDTPVGIFNTVSDRVWHDAGRNTTWIVSFESGKILTEGQTYSFFVRVWYNSTTYAVFKSPGVTVKSKPPKITNILRNVKEIKLGGTTDVDFVDNSTQLFVDWKGKFINNDDSIKKFHLYISTYPGGHDIGVLSQDLPASTSKYNITGLAYQEGTIYYCVIQAYNQAGLHTTTNSDGFIIDNGRPSIGLVNDGEVLNDVEVISSAGYIPSFWHGFVDQGSGIKSYNVCVSTDKYRGSCDVHPLTSVGLQHSVKLVPQVSLTHGYRVVTEVYAFDNAGHMSDMASSSGVTIDTTPPVRAQDYVYSSNILNNPSFETNWPGRSVDNLANLTSGDCSIPDYWLMLSGCAILVQNSKVDALPDGSNFVIIAGTLTQDLVSVNTGHYRLTFYTSYIETDDALKAGGEIIVSIGKTKHVLLLYTKPTITRSSSAGSNFGWQKHTLFFSIQETNITISIANVGHTTHFALDNVLLQHGEVQGTDAAEIKGHVKAHSVFVHDWSSIHADWNFVDDESSIVEYQWALGTTEGGTQLLPFTSLGRQTFAFISSLTLVDGTSVYVTVMAINAAGLKTVSVSEVITVDLTPPTLLWIHDGLDADEDLDFQRDYTISAIWSISDLESGISTCSFAIGSKANPELLKNFTSLEPTANNVSVIYSPADINSMQVFFTLRCTNGAGLMTTVQTDGVKVLTNAPSTSTVMLQLMPQSLTQYPVHDGYHADKTQIRFKWNGFSQDEGIDSYLVALDGGGIHVDELVDGTTAGFTFANFLNLNLQDGSYTVSVSAVNSVNMFSASQTAMFNLYTSPPSLSINNTFITSSWNLASKTLTADWTNVFTCPHPMYYEVTVGGIGNGDILQWQETKDTRFSGTISLDGFPVAGVNLKITVRAITYSGFYASSSKEQFVNLM